MDHPTPETKVLLTTVTVQISYSWKSDLKGSHSYNTYILSDNGLSHTRNKSIAHSVDMIYHIKCDVYINQIYDKQNREMYDFFSKILWCSYVSSFI